MGIIIAILAALLAILPGFPIAYVLSRDSTSTETILRRAIVWSLAVAAAITWVPGGQYIPLYLWLYFLAALAVLGIVCVVSCIRRRPVRVWCDSRNASFAALAVFGVVAIILVARANIDWDAINYYLFAGVDWIVLGHYSPIFSSHVTFGKNAPNTVPPIMPALYSMAILVAQAFHVQADQAIRLIAFVFVVGIWMSTKRIAAHCMPRNWAALSATLFLIMPGTISLISGAPLYLDLGFCFLCVTLIAETLESPGSWRSSLQLGLAASVVVMDKIDGLPFLILLICAIVFLRLPTTFGRIICAMVVVAMFATSTLLGQYSADATLQLYITFALVGALAVWLARHLEMRLAKLSFLPLLVGFIPAICRIITLDRFTGSPAGFYIPELASKQPEAWHKALEAITQANVYAPTFQPGLPGNFGLGLLLWWGFGPALTVLAVIGAVVAIKNRNAILSLLALVSILFEFAFLTVFALSDFRHLFPVQPLLAILAVSGMRSLTRRFGGRAVIVSVALSITVPFAWAAQAGNFGPPFGLLVRTGLDQWSALSTVSLLTIALILATGAMLTFAILRLCAEGQALTLEHIAQKVRLEKPWIMAALLGIFAVSCALCVICFFWSGNIWWLYIAPCMLTAYLLIRASSRVRVDRHVLAIASYLAIAAIWFAPLSLVMVSPGLAANANAAMEAEDGGYVPALRWLLEDSSVHGILTYEGYGVTWFSLGHAKKLDLTDATDVAAAGNVLRAPNLSALYNLGISGAILPSSGSSSFSYFAKLANAVGARAIFNLNDPLQALHVSNVDGGAWDIWRLFPPSLWPGAAPSFRLVGTGRPSSEAFRIDFGRATEAPLSVYVAILGYANGPAGIRPFFLQLSRNVARGSLEIPLQKIRRTAQNSGFGDASIVVRSIAITPQVATSHRVADFTTEGFSLGASPGSALRLPFLLHGEYNVVAEVDFQSRNGVSRESWPIVRSIDRMPTSSRLALALKASSICPPLSPLRIEVLESGGVTTRLSAVMPSAYGETNWRDIPIDSAAEIRSIALTGLDKCKVHEIFRATSAQYDRGKSSAISKSEDLHVVVLEEY